MVTVTFKFNEEKINKLGKKVDELLYPFREMAKEYNINEIQYGVFCKDGDEDMDALILPLKYIRKHLGYIDILDEWTLDVDGEIEDCKAEMISYWERHKNEFDTKTNCF